MLDNSQKDAHERAIALVKIAQNLIDEGNLSGATEILIEAEQLINLVEYALYRGGVLSRISLLRAKIGQWDEALRIANSIEHHSHGPRTRRKLKEMQSK